MPQFLMPIVIALSWLALPVTLLCVIDDWFLRPRRALTGPASRDAPLMRFLYGALPLLIACAVLRLLLAERLDFSAVLLGITVLTGAPILDALEITRAAKLRRPELPVVWGGWHPSLFPAQTLAEAGIDALVVGQGEDAFAEIVDRLAEGGTLEGIAGCHAAGAEPGPVRPTRNINEFPAHDYGRIPVEAYFSLKGQRQLDYISSQGCRFRCAFCPDPFVSKRGWLGLDPARVAQELDALLRHYGGAAVNFQDAQFLPTPQPVAAIRADFLPRPAASTAPLPTCNRSPATTGCAQSASTSSRAVVMSSSSGELVKNLATPPPRSASS